MKRRIFDSHCDTLLRSKAEEFFVTGGGDLQVDLPGLLESSVYDLVMAVCVKPYRGREEDMWERGLNNFKAFMITEKPRLHFALEGCEAIANGWRLPFHPLVASLTWNGDNPYAGGIGSEMDLTDDGRKLIRELTRDNTSIDLSHLNDRSRKSVLKLGLPVCATHCNARKLCNGKNRNLPDEDLIEIARLGGVTGVTFVPDFLEENGSEATIEAVVNHMEYIAEKTSIDNVGFGSDFDGVQKLPPGIKGVVSWQRIIDALENRGWSSENIDKAAGSNWRRFYKLEQMEVSD